MADPREIKEPTFIIGKNTYLQACENWGREAVDTALANNGFVVDDPVEREIHCIIERINERLRHGGR